MRPPVPTPALARPRADRQVGAAAVTSLIFLMVMAAFLALSLNMGILMDTRTQLQAGSDSAALAAAQRLDGTTQGLTNARAAAVAYSDEHVAYGERLIIDPTTDVIFGRWHFTSGGCIAGSGNCVGFEPFTNTFAAANPPRVTAVRVDNGRDGNTHNPVITLPFGSFVGTPTAAVRSAAVAVGPGTGMVQCALPLGVAVCRIRPDPASTDLNCTSPLQFSNDSNDSVGFITFDGSAANGNRAADIINSGMCGGVSVGEVNVQNGNDFGQVIDALRGVGRGNNGGTGNCLINSEQTLPVIDAGCSDNWNNPRFNQQSDIIGFLRVRIDAVTDQNGNVLGCPGDPVPNIAAPMCPRGNGMAPCRNALILNVDCDQELGTGAMGGGEVFNSTGARVRLVQ